MVLTCGAATTHPEAVAPPLRACARRPKFDPSKYEWLPAESIVTEGKTCSAKDNALFTGF